MTNLLRNIRFYILFSSAILSGGLYLLSISLYGSQQTQLIRTQQYFSFASLFFLYLALLAGPLCYTFKSLPIRSQYLKARRALGVSAFYFGLLHTLISFFGQLGGFGGVAFLNSNYILPICLGIISLIILFLLAITSFDTVIEKMTFVRWKLLHRLVYLAGFLILLHAFMLGTHFQELTGVVPQIIMIPLVFLLLLEAQRFDAFLKKSLRFSPAIGISSVILLSITMSYLFISFLPSSTPLSFGIHSQHTRQSSQMDMDTNPVMNMPGMRGDRTKRYTVSFLHDTPLPGLETTLRFKIYNASNGEQTVLFERLYEKYMHLIIVNNELDYFVHLHPEKNGNEFSTVTQFPSDGTYRLYIDYQPFGAIEQQSAFTLTIGDDATTPVTIKPDFSKIKVFGNYKVSLSYPTPLDASLMSNGQQEFAFTITDAATSNPITTLKPYLASFGHLVMINTKTYDYLHVHPSQQLTPTQMQNGGPTVRFLPMGLYGPIKPGDYRIFAQFNPDNKLFTADFFVTVK